MTYRFPPAVTAVEADQVRQWLAGPDEIAFIDVREEGLFGWGHPLLAVNVPYSRLEAEIRTLVPRQDTRIVLLDDDGSVARDAARRLTVLNYTQVHILDGGADAWKKAGFELFEGVNVPSKSFAEVVEHAYNTPSITAGKLQQLFDGKADVIVLDSRTEEEFARFHVPGAISVPGVELVHRYADVVRSPETLVVVSCAGRTRGIMGAQTLINAGVPNKVVALAGGTQGWRLASLELETGPRFSNEPTTEASKQAASRASDVAARFALERIDHARLAEWRADPARTTYVFDVRSPAEYRRGHLPYAVSIQGGQLLQTLDQWAAVRHARIVLVDDDGVRAAITAHWIKQLGWQVSVLENALEDQDLETGDPARERAHFHAVEYIDVNEVRSWLGQGGRIVSVAPSAHYRQGHPAGAAWSIRPRLRLLPASVTAAPKILVTAPDEEIAALAALDLKEIAGSDVRVLTGGDAAWREAGLDWEGSPGTPPDADRLDFLTWNFDRHLGNPDASRAYLQWETELPEQIAKDGGAGFQIPAAG
jgi:rhodanese-related sulfurtransferase